MMRSNQTTTTNNVVNSEMQLPVLELRDLGSGIEVMMVSGLNNKTFMLYEVIGVLEEEGAEVVNASFSTVGDKIFYTVHAQVRTTTIYPSVLGCFLFFYFIYKKKKHILTVTHRQNTYIHNG